MDRLIALLPALGCIVGMPLMMLMMARGSRTTTDRSEPAPDAHETAGTEIAQLRAEVDRLRQEVATAPQPAAQ
jgi:hypothetical protein